MKQEVMLMLPTGHKRPRNCPPVNCNQFLHLLSMVNSYIFILLISSNLYILMNCCNGYLGHPFAKSVVCISMLPRLLLLFLVNRWGCWENQEQACPLSVLCWLLDTSVQKLAGLTFVPFTDSLEIRSFRVHNFILPTKVWSKMQSFPVRNSISPEISSFTCEMIVLSPQLYSCWTDFCSARIKLWTGKLVILRTIDSENHLPQF